MKIDERQVQDSTVVSPAGKIDYGEAALLFRDTIKRLVDEGRKKFVLDLSGVNYIDSSGMAELVYAYMRIAKAGGRIVLVSMTVKIRELLSITKLMSVFQCAGSVDEALRELRAPEIYAKCPAVGCRGWGIIPTPGTTAAWVQCTECAVDFTVSPGEDSAWEQPATVLEIRFPTYAGQWVEVRPLAVTWIAVPPRLDLFAAETVEKAFRSAPQPRRVIFDLDPVLEISRTGLEHLLSLCRLRSTHDRAVALARGTRSGSRAAIPEIPPCYSSQEAALGALGPLEEKNAAWTVAVHHGALTGSAGV